MRHRLLHNWALVIVCLAQPATSQPSELGQDCAAGDVEACLGAAWEQRSAAGERSCPYYERACELGSDLGCHEHGVCLIGSSDTRVLGLHYMTVACSQQVDLACTDLAATGSRIEREDPRFPGIADRLRQVACKYGEDAACFDLALPLTESPDPTVREEARRRIIALCGPMLYGYDGDYRTCGWVIEQDLFQTPEELYRYLGQEPPAPAPETPQTSD